MNLKAVSLTASILSLTSGMAFAQTTAPATTADPATTTAPAMQHGQTMQDGQMQGTQATPDATPPMQGQSMSAGSGIVTADSETMISASS